MPFPPSNEYKHGAVAVLQDDEDRFLFIRRGLTLARAPGVWCFVGGEVEPGETLEEAVEREVLEEVGLTVQALDKVHQSLSPNAEFQLHWMKVRIKGSLTLRPHPVEVDTYRWLYAEEGLLLEPILPTLVDWLKQYANR